MNYVWGGLVLASNVALPRLWASGREPNVRFTWRSGSPDGVPPARTERELRFRDGTRATLRVGGDETLLRYEIEGVGVYLLRPVERAVDFWGAHGTEATEVEHFLNVALATFAAMSGTLCLHAASVAGVDGAVLLAGPSGAGKSTLAWRLVQDGLDLLSDDYTVVRREPDGWMAWPGPRTLRIEGLEQAGGWDNRGKTEFYPRSASPEPRRIRDVVLLCPGTGEDRSRRVASLVALQAGWSWMGPETRARIWSQVVQFLDRVPFSVTPGAYGALRAENGPRTGISGCLIG